MHYSVLLRGRNVEDQLEPFWTDLTVETELVKEKGELIDDYKIDVPEEKWDGLEEEEIYQAALEYYDYNNGDYSIDEETGNVHTSDYNPNAQWDWYEVGGRWAGELKLKDTADPDEYSVPNFSWGWKDEDKDAILSSSGVDSALKKDIANLDDLDSFVVLEDGCWYCKEEYTDEEWKEIFKEFIDGCPDDEYITIVDCHI